MSVAKYLDYKVFNYFKDTYLLDVNSRAKDKVETTLYQHIFMAPDNILLEKNFQLHGFSLPVFSYWANSLPSIPQEKYGKSVLTRYNVVGEDGTPYPTVRFIDLTYNFTIYVASYYKSTLSSLNTHMIEFDAKRYVELDFGEVVSGYKSKVEMAMNKPVDYRVVTVGDGSTRVFSAGYSFTFTGTVPFVDELYMLERIELYLNDNKIWDSNPE